MFFVIGIRQELAVKVIAFDGQFLEIAVQNDNDYPLTTCTYRLQKIVCKDPGKLSKKRSSWLPYKPESTSTKIQGYTVKTSVYISKRFPKHFDVLQLVTCLAS